MNKYQILKDYALEYKVPIILDDSLAIITNLIMTNNIINILEIGTAIGYSSLQMADINTNIRIDTIERNEVMWQLAKSNIKTFGKEEQITLHYGDALEYQLTNLKAQYDMIFFDAAKAQNKRFFERFSPLLSENGIIITDNIDFHGLIDKSEGLSKNLRHLVLKLKDYCEWLKQLENYETTFIHVGDGLAVCIKKGEKHEITC